MSLATPMTNGAIRPGSFLPAIKCSSCGEEIEIAAMGEHTCATVPPPRTGHTPNMSNPFTLRQMNASGQNPSFAPPPSQQHQAPPTMRMRAPTLGASQQSMPRSPRMPPPKINPEAANRPFLAPRPPDAPLSPAVSVRSASSIGTRAPQQRNAPRLWDPRPPSPELSANLDCAFPPFPTAATTRESRPSTSSGRKTPTGSDRAPSRGGTRLDQVMTAEPDPFTLEPKSPRNTGGENVIKRMNTLKNGPFNASRRKPSTESSSQEPPRRPSTATSNYSLPRRPSIPAVPVELKQSQKSMPTRPARPTEEVLSPTFLEKFSAEPGSVHSSPSDSVSANHDFDFDSDQNSETTPPQELSKVRSVPNLRSAGQRPPFKSPSASEPSQIPKMQAFRPRSSSRSGTRVDHRMEDAPPVPRPVQQHRQDSKHAPSESSASSASTENSLTNNSSNGTSPTESAASSIDTFSPLSYEAGRYGEEEDMRVAGLSLGGPKNPGMRAELPKQANSPRNFARPAPPRIAGTQAGNKPATPLESPMDPALLDRSRPAYEPWKSPSAPASRPPPLRSQTAPGPVPTQDASESIPALAPHSLSPGEYDPFRPNSSIADVILPATQYGVPVSNAQAPSALMPPPIPREPQGAKKLTRRATVGKPMCRGCGLMIEGKSVKAADGRLTGRWHKACFTCRTCRQPFITADFYVIGNEPYCEQHYHEHNGSLCHGCHRGIEGEYLETTSSTRVGSEDKKFHPRCFTCCECREVLSDDYFEISGRVFCERHALAAMRAQARLAGPGLSFSNHRGLMAERRTTKLMNMS